MKEWVRSSIGVAHRKTIPFFQQKNCTFVFTLFGCNTLTSVIWCYTASSSFHHFVMNGGIAHQFEHSHAIPLQEGALLLPLVYLAQTGDREAFSEIFHLLISDITGYVRHSVSSESVEDILSDVFFRVWTKISTFHGASDQQFRAWVFRIAHHLIIDSYRAKKDISSLEENDHVLAMQDESLESSPERLTNIALSFEQVEVALEELSPQWRQIILLRYFQDFSHKDIGKILGMREGNVRIILHRALAKLREHLEK